MGIVDAGYRMINGGCEQSIDYAFFDAKPSITPAAEAIADEQYQIKERARI